MTNTTSVTTTTTVTPIVLPESQPGISPSTRGARVTNNVMRSVFEEVQVTKGKTIKELVAVMMSKGFKYTSSESVLYQLIRTGQIIRGDDNLIYPNPAVKTYRPIALPSARKKAQEAKRNAKAKAKQAPSAGIAALKPVTTPTPEAAPQETTNTVTVAPQRGVTTLLIKRDWTPQQVLDTLTLPQAKALYAELQQYFK